MQIDALVLFGVAALCLALAIILLLVLAWLDTERVRRFFSGLARVLVVILFGGVALICLLVLLAYFGLRMQAPAVPARVITPAPVRVLPTARASVRSATPVARIIATPRPATATPVPDFAFVYQGETYTYPALDVSPVLAQGKDLWGNPLEVELTAGTDGEHLLYKFTFTNNGTSGAEFFGTEGVVDAQRQAYAEQCYFSSWRFEIAPTAIAEVTCYTDLPPSNTTIFLTIPIRAQFTVYIQPSREMLPGAQKP